MARTTDENIPGMHLHMNVEERVYDNGRLQRMPVPRMIEDNPSWKSHRNPIDGTLEYQKDFGDQVFVLNEFSCEGGSHAYSVNVFDYNTGERQGQLGWTLHAESMPLAAQDADKLIDVYQHNGKNPVMLFTGNDQPEAFRAERNFHQQRRELDAQRAESKEHVEELKDLLGKKDAQVESRADELKKKTEPSKDANFRERAARSRSGSEALEKEKAEMKEAITKEVPRVGGIER